MNREKIEQLIISVNDSYDFTLEFDQLLRGGSVDH